MPSQSRKQVKKRRSARSSKNKEFLMPRTLGQFFSMPEILQEKWIGVTSAITKMRTKHVSRPRAAAEFGLELHELVQLGGGGLRKRRGRYVARASDRLLRVELIPTRQGLQEIGVPDSRQASRIGKYWNAVQVYLETGDKKGLGSFKGMKIETAEGLTVPLLTDVAELDRLGSAGVLSLQSIYARVA